MGPRQKKVSLAIKLIIKRKGCYLFKHYVVYEPNVV